MTIEENVPLGRLTTVGIGGPARHFARPADPRRARGGARLGGRGGAGGRHDRPRLEPADRRRGRRRARAPARGRARRGRRPRTGCSSAGGGATNAVCLHRARAAGLGGFEFACAIPGTVGGGVQMNAGAYGGDWAEILERALVVSAEGAEWRTPSELGLEYRRSALAPGRGRRARRVPARAAALRRRSRRRSPSSRPAGRPRSRRTSAPSEASSRTRSTSSPRGGCSRPAGSGATGSAARRSRRRHANFIENAGEARAADALALMAEARRRALEEFGVELEHEVRLLGALELPPAGETL